MLQQVKKLYDAGFAIHLLRPRSKIPLHDGWTKGPRETWADLKKEFKAGMNVGVRLGLASRLSDDCHLAIIDCDVKSKDQKHLQQMLTKLGEILPGFDTTPSVESGRGNGSMHVYVKTREVVRGYRIAQSPDMVKVLMPSVKSSKKDIAALTPEEITKGFRIRAAWEISFMSQGQQVVLPPSIHPDSGKAYKWGRNFEGSLGEFKTSVNSPAPKKEIKSDFVFTPVSVDITGRGLDPKIVTMIMESDCDDKSTGLYLSCAALIKAGFSQDEVLSVLTDRKCYGLAETPFEHTKSDNRTRAAQWLYRYTYEKAFREFSCQEDFKSSLVQTEPLSDDAAKAQFDELFGGADWRTKIERTKEGKGPPKNTLKNVLLILENKISSALVTRDLFAVRDYWGVNTPWGSRKGDELADRDISGIILYMAKHFKFEPSRDRINDALNEIAKTNSYHPVREYLKGLEWDGTPRLDGMLKKYFNAAGPVEYLEAVSRKTICAMIYRVMSPGYPFHCVLILQGGQGVGKSRSIEALAAPWFSDTHINIGDKDAVMGIQGKWILELGELSGMRKADTEHLKSFISSRVDRIRPPYGQRSLDFPRQCILIGSTNQHEFLKDETGNRRFWPVSVGDVDVKGLERDRDQLMAEAKFYWGLDEPLYLEGTAKAQAEQEQEARMVQDILFEQAERFFSELEKTPTGKFKPNGFTMLEAFEDFGPFAGLKADQYNMKRAGDALRKLGFRKRKLREGENRSTIWFREENLVVPHGPSWSLTRSTEKAQ